MLRCQSDTNGIQRLCIQQAHLMAMPLEIGDAFEHSDGFFDHDHMRLFFKGKVQKNAIVIFRWANPDRETDPGDNLPTRRVILGVAKARINKF